MSANGHTVEYTHRDDQKTRFENLKSQEKGLNHRVIDLKTQVRLEIPGGRLEIPGSRLEKPGSASRGPALCCAGTSDSRQRYPRYISITTYCITSNPHYLLSQRSLCPDMGEILISK